MNELVKELADQAGFYVESDKIFADDCFDSINRELTNFAELIIKELERMYISGESDPHDVFVFLLDVKERFGVK